MSRKKSAKAYLSEVQFLRRRCEALELRIEELRTTAEGVKAITYDRDRVQTSAENRLEKDMIRLVEVEKKHVRALTKYHAAIHLREKQIAGLDNPLHAELLSMRYLDGDSLQQIADKKKYTYDWTRHLHGLALQEFQKKYLQ